MFGKRASDAVEILGDVKKAPAKQMLQDERKSSIQEGVCPVCVKSCGTLLSSQNPRHLLTSLDLAGNVHPLPVL